MHSAWLSKRPRRKPPGRLQGYKLHGIGARLGLSDLVNRFRQEQQAPGPDYSELNKFQELASLARAFRENGLPAVICSRVLDLGIGVSYYVYGIQ